MIKKILLIIIFVGLLVNSTAFSEEILQTSDYENGKVMIDTKKYDFATYDYSKLYLTIWDDNENQIEISEYAIENGKIICYVKGVIPTKKYIFHAKNIYYDGGYKVDFEAPIIISYSGSGYEVKILKTNTLSLDAFEIYFSNIMDMEHIAESDLTLYMGDVFLAGGDKGGLRLVENFEGRRGVFRLENGTQLEQNVEYRLEVRKGAKTKDGAKVTEDPLIANMYYIDNEKNGLLNMECYQVLSDTVICIFNLEMAEADALLAKNGDGKTLHISQFRWMVDDALKRKILVLEFDESILDVNTIYLDGLQNNITKENYAIASGVKKMETSLEIMDVQIQDPSNIKIEVNQPLTNSDIEDLHVYVKGSDAIAAVAIDEDDPFMIHIELTLQKAIYANTQQNVTLKGQYKDAFGIDHDINLNFPFRFSYVPNFNPRIVKAYFRDEWNIIAKSSHPLLEVPDFEHIKIVQPLVNNDYILPIENIYLEDPFTIRIGLMRSSTMKDVVLKITGMNDASGNLSIEGKFNVDGPWN